MATCPQCQSDNPRAARFCSYCGAALVQHCSSCQQELAAGARFCMLCGEPVKVRTPADDARLNRLAAAAPEPLVHKARAAGHLAGERRVVTILFVDVVNSTALAERMDLETWTAVINGAFDRIIQAIYRYEGTIARTQGDALWAFFGAPIAHEDDPARAVYAALDLLVAARDYAKDLCQVHEITFAIRVCLNTGPVVISSIGEDLRYDFRAMGGAVNMASLLKFATPPMTVLLTENSYRLVAPLFEFGDASLIEIEGRTEPLRTYQVRGPRVEPGQVRGLAAAGLTSSLVGRDAELETLVHLSETALAGLGRAVLIVGEPGLGKTRLVAEWKSAALPAPMRWVEGSPASHGRGQPYHLLSNLLRSLVGVPQAAGEGEVKIALCALIGELFGATDTVSPAEDLEIFPYLGHLLSIKLEGAALERVQQLDPPAIQAQYLRASRQLVQRLAARRPLVLVLDDLHWADPSSVEVLRQLVPLVSTSPLLVCLVTRPERDTPGWKLVHAARDTLGGGLSELVLRPLPETESRRLVANLLDLPEQTRDLILDKAEGNPLFVEEVVRMLIDRGAILHQDGEWVPGDKVRAVEIPGKLQGLLLARIDRLSDEAKNALRVAAVIGRQFPFKVLERVLGTDPTGHLGSLEYAGLIRLAQLEPELAYSFRHTLVQEAAYVSLLKSDRQQLHRAVGEALEWIYPEQLASFELAPRLGQHFLQAGDSLRALHYLTLAGDASLACYANREAESCYREALGLARLGTERALLLSGLGQALYWQSRYEEAIQTWQDGIALFLAQTSGGIDEAAHLYSRSARAAWAGGDTPRGLRICQQGLSAVDGAPDGPGLAFLLHEAARAYLFNGQAEEARPLCRQALEMAERLGVIKAQAEALATLGLLSGQEPKVALDALEKAVQLAESAGLLSQAARAHMNLAATYLAEIEEFRVATTHYRRAAGRHEARGDTAMQLLALGGVADTVLKLGDLVQVEATLDTMRRLMDQLVEPGPSEFHLRVNEATLMRFRGELEEAAGRLRSLQEDARRRNDKEILREVDHLLADTLLEFCRLDGGAGTGGRLWEEAEACLTEAKQICKDWGLSDVWSLCLLSTVCAYRGRLGESRRLLAEARRAIRSRRPLATEEALLALAEARLAVSQKRWTEALTAFEVAAGVYARLEMRWWWARTLQEWAEAKHRRGDPTDLERARALYREALALFEEMGVSRYAGLIQEQLHALRSETYLQAEAHQHVTLELAAAGQVQQGLLPTETPRITGWQLAATLEPAKETSGDFYDFIPMPDGRLAIVVADVADKGAGAALYMALSRTLIRTFAGEYDANPELLLGAVNERILAETHTDMFVTVFYGILDPGSGEMIYGNAGHNPPFLLRARGDVAARALDRTGMPLGILKGASWEQDAVKLAPGDTLVLYSDGLTEAQNPQEELFGEERLLDVAKANQGRLAGELQEALLAEVRQFVGDAPQFDDITLMVVIRDTAIEDGPARP